MSGDELDNAEAEERLLSGLSLVFTDEAACHAYAVCKEHLCICKMCGTCIKCYGVANVGSHPMGISLLISGLCLFMAGVMR